jgi:hypothetical protein
VDEALSAVLVEPELELESAVERQVCDCNGAVTHIVDLG